MSTTTSDGAINAEIPVLTAGINSADDSVREYARTKLVEFGTAAIPALLEALGSGSDFQRWEAAKALGTLADPAAASALVKALDDEDGGVRWLAAEGLIAIGAPSAVPVLERLVSHSESAWLREGAHHVLGSIGYGGLGEILTPVRERLEGVNPRIAVMPAAAEALRRLQE
ncbi:MAG: HEAT repeat domain-containing protein [Dehalococcoidia bacterium]|nr:HEAT repeat domain-containing protein [Dehalococcoidia bacterium]